MYFLYSSLAFLSFASYFLPCLAANNTTTASYTRLVCPPEGPKFARPLDLTQSTILKRAVQNVEGSIHAALNGTLKAGWDVQNTSFSVAVISLQNRKPVWEYHHRATGNVQGTSKVDGDSQYLLGSMSKMVFDMMLVKSGIDLQAPITKYIPELKSNSSNIKWGEITLSALSTHLAGIPTNLGFSEYYELRGDWEKLGIPIPPTEDYMPCNVAGLNNPCSIEQYFNELKTIDPVSPPNRRPVYSGLSFDLLSQAMATFTGKPYDQLLQELLVQPLNLKNTGISPGNNSRAVIPPVENWWGMYPGGAAAGGGLYSSLNDMSAIMHSILSREYMPEATILEWLKPSAFTASIGKAVGRPFEIYRYFNITPDHPQTIDVYAKGGSAYGYSSLFSIFDQYGVGIVWLTAGDAMLRSLLPDVAITQILPALEEEARQQARDQYGKVWRGTSTSHTNSSSNSTNLPFVMNITLDEGLGIIVQNLTRGNYSILDAYPKIYNQTLGKLLGLATTLWPVYRMYPTDRMWKGMYGGREVYREEWRIKWDQVTDTKRYNGTELPGAGVSADICGTWLDTDWIHLAGEAVNKFVFVKDPQTMKVIAAEIPWLRANLTASVSADKEEIRDSPLKRKLGRIRKSLH